MYGMQEMEKLTGIPHWRIRHAIKYREVCRPESVCGRLVFSVEDLSKIVDQFANEGGDE